MNYNALAKDFVNEIYQPLGFLNCQCSNNKMWNYAKEVAVKMIEIFEQKLNQETFEHWQYIKSEITHNL